MEWKVAFGEPLNVLSESSRSTCSSCCVYSGKSAATLCSAPCALTEQMLRVQSCSICVPRKQLLRCWEWSAPFAPRKQLVSASELLYVVWKAAVPYMLQQSCFMKELAAPCFPLHLLQETAGTLDMAPKFFFEKGTSPCRFTWAPRIHLACACRPPFYTTNLTNLAPHKLQSSTSFYHISAWLLQVTTSLYVTSPSYSVCNVYRIVLQVILSMFPLGHHHCRFLDNFVGCLSRARLSQ